MDNKAIRGPPQEARDVPSPKTPTGNASCSSSSTSAAPPQPTTPKSHPASAAPFPTTFVQADAASFKQVVQMLTGSSETTSKHQQQPTAPPPKASPTGPKRPAFKLYERRHQGSFKNLKIVPGLLHPSGLSPRLKSSEIPSPSVVLDFPSLSLLSPATPEDRAIAEKGFYLHPSPRGSDPPPRLLPLFPISSPRAGESTST